MQKETYYAVIFTSTQVADATGYGAMAQQMEALVAQQEGYINHTSARNELGITVSYWKTLEDVKNWKTVSEHLAAQQLGRERWYSWYKVEVCEVLRAYEFNKS